MTNTLTNGRDLATPVTPVDRYGTPMVGDVYYDAVGKLKVSTPQSLIDTDFEYGPQPGKWEGVALHQNRATAYTIPSIVLSGVTNITNVGRVITVTTSSTAGIAVGQPVFIQNVPDQNVNGFWAVDSVSANVSFTFTIDTAPTGTLFDPLQTNVFPGYFYSRQGIVVATGAGAAFTNSGTTVTCTTTYPHGLHIGTPIMVSGTTATTNAPNGNWLVATVPTSNTFTFTVINAPTGSITAAAGAQATLYVRTKSQVNHRAFDGGMLVGNYGAAGSQILRQTRRNFRYQSGKALTMSTGSCMRTILFVDTLTSSGTTVTVTCKYPHGMAVNSQVVVAGCTQTAYNGIFTVTSVPTNTSLTYTAASVPAASPATGFPITINPYKWYGSAQRLGLFDSQNGMYFEEDGQTLYVVRRNSTTILSGFLTVTQGNATITGVGTRFADQLVPGDYVVIRGMTYKVLSIASQTTMYVSPEYRGASGSNVVCTKVVETRVPQAQWDDPCDGNGPSGYVIDTTKMQMFYIDYSWYGAGFVRFGLRGADGNIMYVHKMKHNNQQNLAYLRSGNLPAHYENIANPFVTTLTTSETTTDTTINVKDTSLFPTNGTLRMVTPGIGPIEYVTYTGTTPTSFTGCTRGAAGGSAATAFTPTATAPVAVEYAGSISCPAFVHWGTSVIMDGQFTSDLATYFQTGVTTAISVAAGATQPLISLRIAPSVDAGITGNLGTREVINRMQLKLQTLDILTNTTCLVTVRLNGQVSSGTFASPGSGSLAQSAVHTAGATITNGDTIASTYTDVAGGFGNSTLTSIDLSNTRDIGNSILGGGDTFTVPTTAAGQFPDGPDVLTVVIQNLSGSQTASVLARISWTEAQA